jgi:hypothetical protein
MHTQIDLNGRIPVSLRAAAELQMRNPRLMSVRLMSVGFDTHIETPQLTVELDMPDSVKILGQTIDLSPIK